MHTRLVAFPNVCFHVEAAAGFADAVIGVDSSSFTGAADVGVIMAGLAAKMGVHFENNGVSKKLANPYFWGSARNQAEQCANAAGIAWAVDNGVLAIWPSGGARETGSPLISPETGMVGYPTYTAEGILVRALYNPLIMFGGKVTVESSLPATSREWAVYSLEHDLESLVPGGSWFSTIGCYDPNSAPPVLQ